MTKASKLAIAALLLTAGAAGPGVIAAPQEARAGAQEQARTAALQATAAQAEASINRSAEARGELATGNPDQVRALLLRNGFTADQLKGVPVRIVKAAPSPAARIKSITIKVSCCPPEIVITIRF